MTAPTLYAYDPQTGEYCGQEQASASPLEPGVWLWPAHCTDVAPPESQFGMALVWTGSIWSHRPDHRGETWYSGRQPVGVSQIGDPIDMGLSKDPAPLPLADLKGALAARIDREAEAARMAFVTPGVGQAATYIYKAAEARALLALAHPDQAAPEDYPLLAASVGVEDATLAGVAQLVIATEAAWTGILATIEGLRKAAKAALAAASDNAGAEAAATVAWPRPGV